MKSRRVYPVYPAQMDRFGELNVQKLGRQLGPVSDSFSSRLGMHYGHARGNEGGGLDFEEDLRDIPSGLVVDEVGSSSTGQLNSLVTNYVPLSMITSASAGTAAAATSAIHACPAIAHRLHSTTAASPPAASSATPGQYLYPGNNKLWRVCTAQLSQRVSLLECFHWTDYSTRVTAFCRPTVASTCTTTRRTACETTPRKTS